MSQTVALIIYSLQHSVSVVIERGSWVWTRFLWEIWFSPAIKNMLIVLISITAPHSFIFKMAKARESVLLCRSVKMNTNINGYHLSAGQMLPVLARPGLLDLRKCEGSGRWLHSPGGLHHTQVLCAICKFWPLTLLLLHIVCIHYKLWLFFSDSKYIQNYG